MRSVCFLLCCLMLSGCLTSTRVQGDYISQRDDCRSVAERNAGQYSPQQSQSAALAVKDKNAVLAKIFNECMFINGWTITAGGGQKPNPPRVIAGGKPELDALSQGSRTSAARAAPPQEQQPKPNTYVTPSTPLPADRQPVNVPRGK